MTALLTRPLPPHHDLLDAVASSIGAVVRAVLDDDRDTARQILRDGARRQALVEAAQHRTLQLIVGSADRRTAAQSLLLVSDVARASRLVDDLARLVLMGRAAGEVSDSRREALLLVARFGEERFHQLADGVGGPGLDREFVRCGQCLLAAAERLDGLDAAGRAGTPVVPCCAALATTVLQASRHALRAAG